ncbi:PilZ domain-containing protein [Pseudomonadota bacterium]
MRNVEHRSKKRHTVNFPACLMWEKRLIETIAVNLSPQGALLNVYSHNIPPNASIRVCCSMQGKIYDIPGIVIHNTDGRVGIEFRKQQNEFLTDAIKTEDKPNSATAA